MILVTTSKSELTTMINDYSLEWQLIKINISPRNNNTNILTFKCFLFLYQSRQGYCRRRFTYNFHAFPNKAHCVFDFVFFHTNNSRYTLLNNWKVDGSQLGF